MELPTITKPSFSSSPAEFLKEVKAELKKVNWPSKEEVVKMTTIVIIVSILTGFFISSLDFIFTKLMELAIR